MAPMLRGASNEAFKDIREPRFRYETPFGAVIAVLSGAHLRSIGVAPRDF